ncbi:glutathione S-transferase [Penicillium daleae]|uniref:glutathione transferase n=1 Tax=Penicillium daleae TaxID=63821 RepID=A0AAD6C9B1_9EURO|nr:glutathione S-transferase [Penicillium daleae]KAJ5455715.1 glutathione S-transferase [Penicillium daleae]
MTSIELITDPWLPCPQRVHLAIHELGIDINIREFTLKEKEHKSAEFLKMNPFGALPCLKDSSFDPPLVLYESRAIVRYLALQYGPGRLMPTPSDVRATALFEQAASIELTSFDPVANRLVFEECFKPRFFAEGDDSVDTTLVASLRSRLLVVLDILDQILGNQSYMAGEDYSVVDLFYVPYMHHLTTSVWPSVFENRPHLKSWWGKMKLRPSYLEITRSSY